MRDNFREIVQREVERYLRPRVREVFRQTALAFFDRVNRDDFLFESQTDNLRASMGIGCFEDGVMVEWIENPNIAAQPKTYTYKGDRIEVDGLQLLNEALAAVDVKGLGKWVMIVLAAAPYAFAVDKAIWPDGSMGGKRGEGWWSEDIVPFITEAFIQNAQLLAV